MTSRITNVFARRASMHPMDAHFWGKCIQNLPNLLLKKFTRNMPLGRPTFYFWLKACVSHNFPR